MISKCEMDSLKKFIITIIFSGYFHKVSIIFIFSKDDILKLNLTTILKLRKGFF
jgi:predicted PP-loop superfamily ATPase